jgi:uncharacterized protein YndB with AHSA1/START domain
MDRPSSKPISDAAVKQATGKTWQEWFSLLDQHGAAKMSHKDIARWLHDEKLIESGWWCQSVTVEYEKERGLRVLGQTASAGFEVGVQKTFDMSPEAAWKLVTSDQGVAVWLGRGVKLRFEPGEAFVTSEGVNGEIRSVQKGVRIRLRWQPTNWPSASTLQIYLLPSGSGTSIRFHHEKLDGPERREEMCEHWQAVLSKLKEQADEK